MTSSVRPLIRDRLAWLALVLTLIPFVVVPVPPLVDLTPHAIRMYLVAYLEAGHPLWEYYSFTPVLTPNFGFDALFYGFAQVMSFELALRVSLAVMALIMAAGPIALCRALHGRVTAAGVFAGIFLFSWALQLGFLNYVLSVALACLVLALYLRARDWSSVRSVLVFVPLGLVVWGAHLAGWGVLGLMVIGVELHRVWSAGPRLGPRLAEVLRGGLRGLPLALPVLPTVVWLASFADTSQTSGYDVSLAAKAVYVMTLFQNRWMTVDVAFLGLCLVLALYILAFERSRIAPVAVWVVAIIALAFVFLPKGVGSTYYLDRRMLMPLGLVFFAGLGPLGTGAQGGLMLGRALIGAAAAFSLLTAFAWARFDQRIGAERALLDRVPPGVRVLAVQVRRCGGVLDPGAGWAWARPLAAGLVLPQKGSFVNATWDLPDSNGLAIPYARAEGWGGMQASIFDDLSCPERAWSKRRVTSADIITSEIPRALFDYVWVTDLPAGLEGFGPGFELVGAAGHSVLYRIVPQDPETGQE